MIKKILKYGLITMLLMFLIANFVFKPIKVQGNSMYPTLMDGDWVLVNKASYIFSKPKRGNIVVFNLPNHNKKYLIKRTIGLEKETIEIKFGKVYIDNNMLFEPYINRFMYDSFYKRFIPKDSFFLLGDNRSISLDSRYEDIGFVNEKYIVGKIIFKW